MARQEKAVDRRAGPLQAFAVGLRELRVEAGSPTYRALAKIAGYSAATLSEAAGGVRRPSLDVVLAYVGACRGDTVLWKKRWHELQAALLPPSVARADGTPAPAAAPVSAAVAESPVPPGPAGRKSWPWHSTAAVLGLVVVLAAATVGAFARRTTGHPGCPKRIANPAFTAETYGAGARVHTGAVRDSPVTSTIASGCTVDFVGLCLGEKVHDNTGGSPDVRWFIRPDGQVITSGIIHGNPPPGLAPARCTEDHPAPGAVRLAVTPDPVAAGTVLLSADGTALDIVGFAVLSDPGTDQPGPRRWRQIGLTEQIAAGSGFSVPWKADGVVTGGSAMVFAAAACLGGDGPTEVVDARTSGGGTFGPQFPPVALSAGERALAAQAACRYPP